MAKIDKSLILGLLFIISIPIIATVVIGVVAGLNNSLGQWISGIIILSFLIFFIIFLKRKKK